MSRRQTCPLDCACICHDTGGVTAQHNGGRCPTKDGQPLQPLVTAPAGHVPRQHGDGRSDYDLGWIAGFRGTTPPENPSPEWGQGYSAGFGALLADEKRLEQRS